MEEKHEFIFVAFKKQTRDIFIWIHFLTSFEITLHSAYFYFRLMPFFSFNMFFWYVCFCPRRAFMFDSLEIVFKLVFNSEKAIFWGKGCIWYVLVIWRTTRNENHLVLLLEKEVLLFMQWCGHSVLEKLSSWLPYCYLLLFKSVKSVTPSSMSMWNEQIEE